MPHSILTQRAVQQGPPGSPLAAGVAELLQHSTGNVVTLTGVGTTWLSSAPTFQLSGGTGASITAQSIISDTSATITVSAGSAVATLTITDPSTGGTDTIDVVLVATALTISGPSEGYARVASATFTVALSPEGSRLGQSVTVTPSISPDGTATTPIAIPADTVDGSTTFTVTPAAEGAHTVSITNNRSLTNPDAEDYDALGIADLPSLQEWYSADVGVYSDAGTTPATDGGTVRQWNDRSGNGHHLSQGTSGDRPVYAAGVRGALGSLVFDGTKFLENTSVAWVNGAATFHLFALVEQWDAGALVDLAGEGFDLIQTSGQVSHTYNNVANQNTKAHHKAYLHEVRYDGALATNDLKDLHYADNRAWATVSRTNNVPAALSSNDGLRVGDATDGSLPATMRLSELIVCDDVLSATEIAAVRAYLAERYDAGSRRQIICIGDSLTAGQASTVPYPNQLQTSLGTEYRIANMAVTGSGTTSAWATGWLDEITFPTTRHPLDVAVVILGHNDLQGTPNAAALYANIQDVCAHLRGLGYTVVVGTVWPSSAITGDEETARVAYNDLIEAGAGTDFDYVVLTGDAPELQDPTDTDYFQGDEVHLETAGNAVVAALVQAVLEAIPSLVRRARGRLPALGRFPVLAR